MNGSEGSTATNSELRVDEATLFAEYQDRLISVVSIIVRTSRANIDDACSFAWLQLVRTQPERQEIFAWLRTVATREAIRLDRAQLRLAPEDELDEPQTCICWNEVLEALQVVGDLSPRLRRIFALHIAGYSYVEIAEQTGDTRRTVERQMMRGRRSLARLRPVD